MRKFFLYWLPPLAWMGLLFALSAQPDLPHPPGPWMERLFDKAAHAVSYGVLAWLLLRAFGQHHPRSVGLRALCVVLAVLYGASDEYHQAFVPGRSASLADLAADVVGATVAMLLLAWLERRRHLARRSSEAR